MNTTTTNNLICVICGERTDKLNVIGAHSVRIWVCDSCAAKFRENSEKKIAKFRKTSDPRIRQPVKHKDVFLK